jgi:MFS family permease
LSDRFGRRGMARLAVVTSVVATLVLMLGAEASGWLYVGWLLAGVGSGVHLLGKRPRLPHPAGVQNDGEARLRMDAPCDDVHAR